MRGYSPTPEALKAPDFLRERFADKTATVLGVAGELGCSTSTVLKYLRKYGIPYSHTARTEPARRKHESTRHLREALTLTETQDLLQWPIHDRRRNEIARALKSVEKALVLSDLHIPFWDPKLIEQALDRDGDAPLVVIAGDLLNLGAFSSFAFKDNPLPFKTEFEAGVRFVSALRETHDVLLIKANHERRLSKLIDGLSAEAAEFLADFTDVIRLLQTTVEQKAGDHKAYSVSDWWCRVGDAAICHADEFSSIHGRSVTNVADWFDVRRDLYPGLRLILQAHTHHQVNIRYRGYRCIESGCLAQLQDYIMGGKLKAGKRETWQMGYAVLRFREGKADVNECKFVELA